MEIRPAIRDGIAHLSTLGQLVPVALPTDIPYLEAITVIAIAESAETTEALIGADGFESLSVEQRAGIMAGTRTSRRTTSPPIVCERPSIGHLRPSLTGCTRSPVS